MLNLTLSRCCQEWPCLVSRLILSHCLLWLRCLASSKSFAFHVYEGGFPHRQDGRSVCQPGRAILAVMGEESVHHGQWLCESGLSRLSSANCVAILWMHVEPTCAHRLPFLCRILLTLFLSSTVRKIDYSLNERRGKWMHSEFWIAGRKWDLCCWCVRDSLSVNGKNFKRVESCFAFAVSIVKGSGWNQEPFPPYCLSALSLRCTD